MELDKVLNEMEEPQNTQETDSKEGIKVLINNSTAFRGRISKPMVVYVKYKDLAAKIKEASGLPMTREKAQAIFDVVLKSMGL